METAFTQSQPSLSRLESIEDPPILALASVVIIFTLPRLLNATLVTTEDWTLELQPAVCQFRGYSVEPLMRFLVALGRDVEIVVKPRKHGTAELRVP